MFTNTNRRHQIGPDPFQSTADERVPFKRTPITVLVDETDSCSRAFIYLATHLPKFKKQLHIITSFAQKAALWPPRKRDVHEREKTIRETTAKYKNLCKRYNVCSIVTQLILDLDELHIQQSTDL
jgi:hypothetical protein